MRPSHAPISSQYSKRHAHQEILAPLLVLPTICQSLHQGRKKPHLSSQIRPIYP